jgi:SAM-dependent methyltransferase
MPSCPICGLSDPVREERPLADGKVLGCANCGLVFFSPMPGAASPRVSAHSVETGDGRAQSVPAAATSAAAMRRLRQMALGRHRAYQRMLGRSDYRLLEVGCGTADLGPCFAALGVRYHGIDRDDRCADTAPWKDPSIRVERQDFFELANDEPADVLCFSQVLEHIVDPLRFAEKVYAQLTPGGVVHCDVPNHDGLAGVLSRLRINPAPLRWGAIEYPRHLMAYRKKTLRRLFSKGFEARAFGAVSSHPCWGQPLATSGSIAGAYWTACRLLQMHNLLVLIGKKRTSAE